MRAARKGRPEDSHYPAPFYSLLRRAKVIFLTQQEILSSTSVVDGSVFIPAVAERPKKEPYFVAIYRAEYISWMRGGVHS